MDISSTKSNNLKNIFNIFPLNIFKYFFLGIFSILIFIAKFIQYFVYGFGFPLILINKFRKPAIPDMEKSSKEQKMLEKEEAKFRKQLLAQEAEEKKLRENMASITDKDEYTDDSVKLKKPSLKTKLNNILNNIFSAPSLFSKKIKEAKGNSSKKDIDRQALLIDISALNEEKSTVKLMYQYIAKAPDGKTIKGYFEGYSKTEVLSYLISEGYEVYNIKTSKYIQLFHSSSSYSRTKMANKDLIFFLTQLSTYIKSGIPLVDSLKILSKQYKKVKYKELFKALIYELSTGESLSSAMSKQGNAFPKILINMIKASEMTGELPETLDDMSEYFTNIEKTRKQMITAMMYPTIIFVVAIAVITFILLWVIPRFVDIYASMDAKIPAFTQMILNLSEFLKNYIYYVFGGIIGFLLILIYLYKNVKSVRYGMQWLAMHIPVMSNVIIYNEVTIFTKTFASLLSHNVFITDSMEILNQVTDNEIYRSLIKDTIINLAKGEKLSTAFENNWAFPIPAYEMLVTGEKTGQLPEMMKKVSDYYQELHTNSVSRIKTLVEPVLIVFLTVVVGAIILAIVIPMFGVYGAIQDLE